MLTIWILFRIGVKLAQKGDLTEEQIFLAPLQITSTIKLNTTPKMVYRSTKEEIYAYCMDSHSSRSLDWSTLESE